MFRILINQTLHLDTYLIRRMFGWNGRRTLDRTMLFITLLVLSWAVLVALS